MKPDVWEPGTSCTLTINWWDGPMPVEGDLLRTPAGACYLIDEIRTSRGGRRRLRCTRLDRNAVQFGEPGVFEFVWAGR